METFAAIIKEMRINHGEPLRRVSAYLDIDQAILSKIERGQRKPTRAQVLKLAEYFKVEKEHLLVPWLSDKLVYYVEDEENALEALKVAEEKIMYLTKPKVSKIAIIDSIVSVLTNDGRVSAAWLFGSLARGEENFKSDVDLMVEMNDTKKHSMFDLLDISFLIENKIKMKVDLVEKGYLKEFAMKTAANDVIKIYG